MFGQARGRSGRPIPTNERRQINHPVAVLLRWEADKRRANDTGDVQRKPSTGEQLRAAQHELARMRRERVEAIFAMTDAPEDKARSLVAFLARDLSLGEMAQVLQHASAEVTQRLIGGDSAASGTDGVVEEIGDRVS